MRATSETPPVTGTEAPSGALSSARYPWWTGLVAALGAGLLRALGGTWRVEWAGKAQHDAVLALGQGCVYALWHSRLLSLVFTHRGRGAAVLVSRHRDGELITRLIAHLGFVTARGSSTRGGEEGLREMIEWAARGHLLAITPDGPRGPAERVKPGLAYLASRTGCPVIPVAAAAPSCWRLDSWDGFRIPKPFARVLVGYGAPIVVPAGLEREALESARIEIERAIAELTSELDRRSGALGPAEDEARA